MLHRIAILIVKELQTLLRDRQGRLLLVMPVLMQLVLFPNAATMEVRNNTLGVYDQDAGAVSTELVQRFARAAAFSRLLPLRSEAEMRRAIETQRALVVLRIPPDFSRAVVAGRPASLQAILDGRRSNSGQISLGYLRRIVGAYAQERQGGAFGLGTPELVVRHWFNPNLSYPWFIVPGLVAIITTIGTLVVTALSIAREQEQGTLDQLLVSPFTPGMIMAGKAVPALLVALVQATVIVAGGVFAYRIPFQGSLLLLYGCIVVYVLALIGFGLFISSLCSTQQQALLGVLAFMMPAVLLSGFVAPVENMPGWLQRLSWLDPLRHFMPIARGIFLKDLAAADAARGLWPLLLIAAVTSLAAGWIFRRRFAR